MDIPCVAKTLNRESSDTDNVMTRLTQTVEYNLHKYCRTFHLKKDNLENNPFLSDIGDLSEGKPFIICSCNALGN